MLQEINNIKNNLLKENKEYIEKFKLDFDNIKNNVLKEMDTIKTEAINAKNNAKKSENEAIEAKDNAKKSEVEINNIKTNFLQMNKKIMQ